MKESVHIGRWLCTLEMSLIKVEETGNPDLEIVKLENQV
jgi:hypothetical protein